MKVRRRTATDLDACERLARIVHERDGYPPRLAGDLRRFITSEALAVWVAEDGPHIVGNVALHAKAPREVVALTTKATGQEPAGLAFVARLLVAPSHRRRGIGRELLDVATRDAHRRSRWPVLDVATTFRPAIQLYEAAGWTRAGSVTVELPRERPLEELVYLGPAPPGVDAER